MRRSLGSIAGFEEGFSYQLVPQAPAPSAQETDSTHDVIEVCIVWGEQSVLHVEHVPLTAGFSVGEARDARGRLTTNFLIGSETLGSERVELLREQDGECMAVVPVSADARAVASGVAVPLEDVSSTRSHGGERLLPLARELRVSVQLHGFTFIMQRVVAARPIGTADAPRLDPKRERWTLASFAGHTLLLLGFYFLPPTSSALSIDLLATDPRFVSIAIEPPETEPNLDFGPEPAPADDSAKQPTKPNGGEGRKPRERDRKTHEAPGGSTTASNEPTREQQQDQARKEGILGILRNTGASLPGVSSVFSADAARNGDPDSALLSLLDGSQGRGLAGNGLGMIGVGRGGGRPGDTIGVGPLGTRGDHGGGPGGHGTGALGGLRDRQVRVPHITALPAEVRGGLSKEIIRRVINRNVAQVRYCYSQALIARPELQGRVAVTFVISPSGSVLNAVVSNSSLGNLETERCIADAVRRWDFPAPEGGGIVSVTYPFVLQQVGD